VSAEEAWDALRRAGWRPGVSLVGHPLRAECKAALAVLRKAGVDPRTLGLAPERQVQPRRTPRLSRHVKCAAWAVVGLLVGYAFTAYAQDTQAPLPPSDFDDAWRLAQTLGLPGVMAWASWTLRGLLRDGIVVRLSDEDRELLRKPGA
jgi:hypothetical protein